MAKAIQFAVRDAAGGMARGFVAGDGTSNFIQMGVGDEISLNLARQSVASFIQKGDDLVITLIDGREITLDGYFNATGEANQLYLSQGGEVAAVEFSPSGNGTLYASYGPTDGWDKFSTMDNLRFAQTDDLALAGGAVEEPAGMAGFVPGLVGLGGLGAGLIGAGLIAGVVSGGGGGGGGSTGPRAPTVNDPTSENKISTVIGDKTPNVSGTGEPGDTVKVTIGDKTQTTVIKEDGTWAVEFPDLPADGKYESEAEFTHSDGTKEVLDGPGFGIDMTPPPVAITGGDKASGHIENAAEYADGKVTIKGTGEIGATIKVEIDGYTQNTTVGSDGTWTVNFPTTQIKDGEYETSIKVTATDSFQNSTVISGTLVVDTINNLTVNNVTSDNAVNSSEASAGFAISGSSQAGSTVKITLQGITQTVTADASGKWTFNFEAGKLTPGEYDATITATSTDTSGNTTTSSHTFRVDTTTSVTLGVVAEDDLVNGAEAAAGVTMSGTGEAGSSIKVEWNGKTGTTTVGTDGTWSVNFTNFTGGTLSTVATVTATDKYGNTASTTRTVKIDTETSVSIDNGQSGGDDIVSGAEQKASLVLTGKAEAGATVEVTFEGVTRTVTADANGVWKATYVSGEYPTGTYESTISVKSTDLALNTATATHTINVDTEVTPFAKQTDNTGTDKVLNDAEAGSGLIVTGVVEKGSTVMVSLNNGTAIKATVEADGTWTATIPKGQIPTGEAATNTLTITATDHVGNTSTITENVVIDREVRNLATTGQIAGDDIVNAAEAAAGVEIKGTVEPNSTVTITLSSGASATVQVGSDGLWTHTFSASELPSGTGTETVTIKAVDAAQNVKTITDTFTYDTVAPDALDVTAIAKSNGNSSILEEVRVVGVSEDVSLFRVDANGAHSEINFTKSGSWLGFSDNGVPDGSYLVIQNEDLAGNSSSTLLVVNNTNVGTIDLNRAGLENFDFSVIDLNSAPQANLTITASDIARLTGVDHELTIKGGADDHVTLQGATRSADDDVSGYHAYSIGGGTVLVDENIKNVDF